VSEVVGFVLGALVVPVIAFLVLAFIVWMFS